MTTKTLVKKCRQYDEIVKQMDELDLMKKKLQAELKEELERNEVDEMDVDVYHFSNKLSKGRTTFDSKAFAVKHPKLFAEFTKEGKASTRFLFGLIK